MSGIPNQSSAASRSDELWENGHVLITTAASSNEIDEHRSAINDAVLRLSNETRLLEDRSTYDKAFFKSQISGKKMKR
jgi:hypothetical protein